MSEEDSGQSASSRAAPDDFDSWNAYWTAQGMPWRTEPESDAERQRFLAERRALKADTENGLYPFRHAHGSIKLARAEVEWLVATHSTGAPLPQSRRPGRNVWKPFGPDLRGADLNGANLAGMPLDCARLDHASLKVANLDGAHLEDAWLDDTDCTGATLRGTYLR